MYIVLCLLSLNNMALRIFQCVGWNYHSFSFCIVFFCMNGAPFIFFQFKMLFILFYIYICLFIRLCRVLVAACVLLSCGVQTLSCNMHVGSSSLHWECGVLTTAPPGKSLFVYSFKKIFFNWSMVDL